MTEKKDTILQQFHVLKEMHCVKSVSSKDAIVGDKYLFYCEEWGFTHFYIGELNKVSVTKLSNKRNMYTFQFKSCVKVNQFLPTFRGCKAYKSSLQIRENKIYFELYHLNYLNYLKNSK